MNSELHVILKTGDSTTTISARKKGTTAPDGHTRLTVNIRNDLHMRLKLASVRQRTPIGKMIESWIESEF